MENAEGVNSEEEETTVQKDRKRKFDTDLKSFLPQVQSLILPNVLHDFNNLQGQHVLPQVWSTKITTKKIHRRNNFSE